MKNSSERRSESAGEKRGGGKTGEERGMQDELSAISMLLDDEIEKQSEKVSSTKSSMDAKEV